MLPQIWGLPQNFPERLLTFLGPLRNLLYNFTMPTVNEIIAMREQRRKRQKRNPERRLGIGCSLLLSLLASIAIITSAIFYTNLVQDLPSLEALPVLLNPSDGQLLHPTRIYDRSREHVLLTLQDPAAQGSQYLLVPPSIAAADPLADSNNSEPSLSEGGYLPASLIAATIASVEPGFWSAPGFPLAGIVRGGQSTIAQKVVSDLLLWNEPAGLRRTLRERLLAAQITARYGKIKVLEWYLNSAKYGHLVYGADAAARVYFGKSATELNLGESAWLAAISRSPMLPPDAEQQAEVLQTMLDQRLIDAQQAAQARRVRPATQVYPADNLNPAGAFTRYVLAELDKTIDRTRLERGGLQIVTSLDYELQIQAACTINAQLAKLGSQSISSAGEMDCVAARLLPTLAFNSFPTTQNLTAGAVILDPKTGEILALAGDPAIQNNHSPGSMLTPFIYLTAFTRGLSPASLLWDIPPQTDQVAYQNFDGQYHGPMRLRSAFANDYINPAAQLFERLGPENVFRTAKQLGLASLDTEYLTGEPSSLQDSQATLLELTRAFGIISNQGSISGRPEDLPARNSIATPVENRTDQIQQAATLIPLATLEMQDAGGQIWLDWNISQSRPVITPQLAYLVTNVLSDEAARWPSLGHPNALEIGRPAAVKLGRAIVGEDTWTIGYTPQLVTGVWVGSSDPASATSEQSVGADPSIAAAIWHAIMQYAHQDLPTENWVQPAGVTTVEVCDPSGMLPTVDCPSVVSEVFLAGSEPTQSDSLFQSVQINRETGRLATVFTPAASIVDKVFMMVPPEAQTWARNAGIETPPETYDVIADPGNPSPSAHIDEPAMFAHVSKQVIIKGSAKGDQFAYYRIQVGKGLNPQAWFQVGDDIAKPVENGALASWDTSDLSGLYAVQLLVVRTDQRVDSDVIQVTIDNQPPEASILYPADGQVLSEKQITFQADAADNLNIKEVSFLVDGRLVSSLTQAPFAAVWQTSPGSHTLRLKATDLAGNTTETEIQFSVKR